MNFFKGLRDGIPIALGYLSVSIGFGILAFSSGLSPVEAFAISASNLTSAGQVAGVGIIASGGTYFEMALTQLIINLRYSLMGISLSQKLDDSFNTPHRMIAAYGITDEIFAVAHAQKEKVTPNYMYGVILIAFLGWTSGTVIGAVAGQLLPPALTSAMGIALYGMFIAVIVPAARESKGVFAVIIIAAVFSIVFYYLLTAVSSGFAIIICSVAAAALAAILFPVKEEEAE